MSDPIESNGGAEAEPATLPKNAAGGVRQGWRFFHCEDCEYRWKAATRDWRSPSGDNCPRCGEWWFPYHSEADDALPVDRMGNLLLNK